MSIVPSAPGAAQEKSTLKPIRNGCAGYSRAVTKCCGEQPVTMGSYPRFYRTCPNCGRGDVFRDVTQETEYVPSAAERALHERLEALEAAVRLLTAGAR